MKEKLEAMLTAAKQALADAVDETALQDVRVQFLGKKGELTAIMKGMGACQLRSDLLSVR